MAQLLSSRSNYGLMVLMELAKNCERRQLSLHSIASSQGLSLSYLEQIMPALRRARLVEAERGRGGGYRLARRPESISVVELLEVLEGPVQAIGCQGTGCPAGNLCSTCSFWLAVQRRLHRMLREVTIADLVAKDRCYILK